MAPAPMTIGALTEALKSNHLGPHALRALQHDPRAGARALWHKHATQTRRQRDESARLDRLLRHERALWQSGAEHVGGLDEVGVGPLLGPVVAAVVVLPKGLRLTGIDDSKKLSRHKRAVLAEQILAQALGFGLGICSAQEIDAINIFRATQEAMRRAVMALTCDLDHLLVDAHRVPAVRVAQTAIVGGDRLSHSIAAASIVAKEARDSMIVALDAQYPGYGLAQHMGYGTAQHLDALGRLGPTPHHRRSFGPVGAAALAHGCP